MGALGSLGCVLNEHVRDADPLDRKSDPAIVEELYDGGAEPAGEAVLFERDEAPVRLGQFEQQRFVERDDEASVHDGRADAVRCQQRVRVERGVDGVAERENRDLRAAAQHLGLAEHERRPLVEPRG